MEGQTSGEDERLQMGRMGAHCGGLSPPDDASTHRASFACTSPICFAMPATSEGTNQSFWLCLQSPETLMPLIDQHAPHNLHVAYVYKLCQLHASKGPPREILIEYWRELRDSRLNAY